LSALGNLTWVKACVGNAEGEEHLIRPLIASLNYMLTHIHALYQDYSRDRSHDLPFKGSRTLASTLARLLGLGCPQNGIQARDLDHSLSYLRDVGCSCSHMCVNHLERAKVGWRSDAEIMKLFSSEYTVAQTLQSRITTFMPLAHAWTALVEVCLEQWPVQAKLATETVGPNELTADTLAILVADLTASDDAPRKHARKVLTAERRASELGRLVIEQMAALVNTPSTQPQVATVLESALGRITYDVPIWIAAWIMEAEKAESAFSRKQILYRIRHVTPTVFETVFNALQNAGPSTNLALLTSIRWMARLDQIPKTCQRAAGKQLMTWLQQESEPNIRHVIIEALGNWPENRNNVISILLASLNTPSLTSDLPVLYVALARLAARQPAMVKHVRTILANACYQPEAAAALIRLNVADAKYKSTLKKISACGVPERYLAGKRLLSALAEFSPDKYHLLAALLNAATDDDVWDGDYHGILMNAVGFHVEYHPDLLKMLLTQLQQALSKQEWSRRRTLLAAVAACIEVMPTVIQQTAHQLFLSRERFEELLVQGTTDPASQDTRRFALAALSYLRTATGAVIPALLQACQDTEEVQLAAIDAARRFQSIQGNPLPRLVEALTDESLSTARVASQLLSSLGCSAAGEIASLREEIIEVLVSTLRSLGNRENAGVVESNRTELEDALYRALLQVAGWQQLAYRV